MKPALLLIGLLATVAVVVGWVLWTVDDSPALGPVGREAPLARDAALGSAQLAQAQEDAPSGARLREELRGGAEAAREGPVERTGGSARLRGRVVDAAGQPVADARVLLGARSASVQLPLDADPEVLRHFDHVRETRTAPDGTFALRGLDRRGLRLAVRAPGFAPYDDERLRLESDATELAEIVLHRGIVLEGVVLDASDQPVPDATLLRRIDGPTLFAAGGAVLATTADDGTFRIDTLAAGPWVLHVRAPEHPVLVERGETPQPGDVRTGLVLKLERGGSIAGRVTGTGTEALEELAVIAVLERRDPVWDSERQADVGSDGTFELRGLLPDRRYELVAAPRGSTGWNVQPTTAPVFASTGDRDVVLTRTGGGDLLVRPVDAASGDPIADVSVRIEPEAADRRRLGSRGALLAAGDPRTERTPDGTLRARGMVRALKGGTMRVELVAEGYEPWWIEGVPVLAGEDVNLGVAELRPVPGIRVRVVDALTREPLEGATVHLRSCTPSIGRGAQRTAGLAPGEDELIYSEGRRRQTTDAEGRATVLSEDGQLSFVWAHHVDRAPCWPVRARPGAPSEVELRLGHGGTVEARVTGADGQPAADTRVAVALVPRDASQSLSFARTLTDRTSGADGLAVFEHLAPGEYLFALVEDDDLGRAVFSAAAGAAEQLEDPGRARASVEEGSTHVVQLLRRPRGTLVGVVSEAGRPLPGATVRLEPDPDSGDGALVRLRGGTPVAKTDGEGAFRLAAVRTGPWRLVVEHPGRAMGHVQPLVIATGESRISIELDDTTIAGFVLDGAGSAVAGARVWAQASDAAESGHANVRALRASSGEVLTTEEGAFELRGVRADVALRVAASHPSYRPAVSPPVTARPGARVDEIVLSLERGGDLVVRVLGGDERRAAVVVVPIGFSDPVPSTAVRPTESGGTTRFPGLAPGTWEVQVSDLRNAGTPYRENVVIRSSETTEVEITLP